MNDKINRQVMSNMETTINGVDKFVDSCWDMWLLGMSSLTASNEQMEQITKGSLDQRKTAVTEGSKVIEQMVKQVRNDQASMLNIVKDAIKRTFEDVENMPHPVGINWAEINKRYQSYFQNGTNVA